MRIKFLVLLFVILVLSFLSVHPEIFVPDELYADTVGKPVITQSTDRLFCGISQILNDDDTLFLAYDHVGVVQAYDFDGNYLYSISMKNQRNGGFIMATVGDMLYVIDKENNVYIFDDDQLIQFLPRENSMAKSLSSQYMTNWDDQSDAFELRLFSIWNTSEESSKCILKGLFWYEKYEFLVVLGIPLSMLIVYKMLNNRKKRKY